MHINKNTVKIPGVCLSCVPSLFSKAYWLSSKTCQKNRATWTLVAISKRPHFNLPPTTIDCAASFRSTVSIRRSSTTFDYIYSIYYLEQQNPSKVCEKSTTIEQNCSQNVVFVVIDCSVACSERTLRFSLSFIFY
jgi:hypothetical protein